MVVNTHSHADHIGGNALIRQRTGCPVYAAGVDRAFVEFPVLEPSFLYGGYPFKALRNKFLLAEKSEVLELSEGALPEGLKTLRVDGHSFAMTAIGTGDGVWFLADCLTGAAILEKYHVSFLYDVKGYLDALDEVEKLEGKLFVPAHAEPVSDIRPLVRLNRDKALEIIDLILEFCARPLGFEDILKAMLDHYALTMDFNQYVLVGSTLRSYLSYLYDAGRLEARMEDNRLYWVAKE